MKFPSFVDYGEFREPFSYWHNESDYSEDNILSLEIVPQPEKKINVNARLMMTSGELVTVAFVINREEVLVEANCQCPFHYHYMLCPHLIKLIDFLEEKEYSLPYTYKSVHLDNPKALYDQLMTTRLHQKMRAESTALLNRIMDDAFDQIRHINSGEIHIVPEIQMRHPSHLSIKFKMGTEKLYVVKDFYSMILEPFRSGSLVKLGKGQNVRLTPDHVSDTALNYINFIQRNQENWIASKEIQLSLVNVNDFYETFKEDERIFDRRDLEPIELQLTRHADQWELTVTNQSLLQQEVALYSNLVYVRLTSNTQLQAKNINYVQANLLRFFEQYEQLMLSESEMTYLLNELRKSTNSLFIVTEQVFEPTILPESELHLDSKAIAKPQFYIDMRDDETLSIEVKYLEDNMTRFYQTRIAQVLQTEFNATMRSVTEFDVLKPRDVDYFLSEGIVLFEDICQVMISDVLRQLSRPKRLHFKVGVTALNAQINLSFESDDVDLKELNDILKMYRRKQKFYRLKNGERIVIHERQFEALDELLNALQLNDMTQKVKKVPAYRLYQLKDLPTEYIETSFDHRFEAMFQTEPLELRHEDAMILRDYQVKGVEWLLKLRSMTLGGLLADDMGLGKSLQIISYLNTIYTQDNVFKPSLIIAPASLIYNWEAEFSKFNSPLDIDVITGTKEQRMQQLRNMSMEKAQIYLTTYDYLRRDSEAYEAHTFDTIILDEGHYIKNKQSQISQETKLLQSDYKFVLTGTPIENSLSELWSLFDFLMPGYLYPHAVFQKRFEKPIVQKQDTKRHQELKQLVSPFILRRLKSEVLAELPDKIEEAFYVKQTDIEKQLYLANLAQANQLLSEETNLKSKSIQVLALLTRLRQLALDPRLIVENMHMPSSKLRAALSLIQEAKENGENVIVFSSFTTIFDYFMPLLQTEKIDYLILTGTTSKEKRQEYVNMFQNGDVDVFLISLKAGGTGLNLTRASVVIHLDPWWNMSAQNQATDRAYRIGQQRNVTVYKLITKDTIEEKIEKLQSTKQEIADAFVENSTGSIQHMSESEIRALFTE